MDKLMMCKCGETFYINEEQKEYWWYSEKLCGYCTELCENKIDILEVEQL